MLVLSKSSYATNIIVTTSLQSVRVKLFAAIVEAFVTEDRTKQSRLILYLTSEKANGNTNPHFILYMSSCFI